MTKKFTVTPWEVEGEVDYKKLMHDFGTQPLTEELIKKISHKAGYTHHFLRRKIFFSHRELDVALKEQSEGKNFALYTGRGPSGNTHLGHIVPWIFTKYLQDAYDSQLYFQITDDEKFLCKDKLSMEDTKNMAYENALDVIAVGFKQGKTHIIVDTDYSKTLYNIAIQVAKKVTASTAKSVFGFTNETNIGMYFWPAMQAAPCILPSYLEGKKIRTLIPAAIDQDPYWRIVRDVAPKLGYPKTAAVHCVFLPALTGPSGKMSTSTGEQSTIFTTDDEKTVRNKINKYAFSGGQTSIKEHREKGGNPDVDVSYQWLRFFEEDDKKLEEIYNAYKNGDMLTGELKNILIDKVNEFLKEHQRKKEQARKVLDKYLLKD
jgi:tryptophanyl-tRNA synthetase